MPEIHSALEEEYGVTLSARHVANLFGVFMALVHCVNADKAPLRKKLVEQGRIILSIDAVQFDATSPALYVLRDTISRRILYSERVPTRDTEQLRVLLKKVIDIGVPIVGVVSDKEKAQILAVEQELPGVPHQYCQTHFLKNVVKQMEADLAILADSTSAALKDVRKLEKDLPDLAESLGSTETELKLAKDLCKAVATGGRTSGDSIVNPPPLKRFERVEAVLKVAEKAAGVKAEEVNSGGPGTTRNKERRKQSLPLLCSVLGSLVALRVHLALAARLRQQVEMVRKVAHILKLTTAGTQVKRILSTYLNQLLRTAHGRDPKSPLGDFIRHIDALADRYWAGLFHCYDVPGLPSNNNDLERMFGQIKRNERKVTGRKSTAGGPIETCAEFLVEAWDTTLAEPNLAGLLKEISDAELTAALEEMEKLSEVARTKRRIQRDPDAFLSEALNRFLEG